jgi:hypothetical protein
MPRHWSRTHRTDGTSTRAAWHGGFPHYSCLMPTLAGQPRFPDDDGSADPKTAAALAAFGAGDGSEHAALHALASSRLLVPVVAVLAEEISDAGHGIPAEKPSEMAVPKLIGQDGRSALPAFTCADSLSRWRPDARPVAASAADVWRAAVEDSCAVVVDVAGPVPLAVEGARLAALAQGGAPPLPEDDPDVRAAVAAAVREHAPGTGFRLLNGSEQGDLLIELYPPSPPAGDAAQAAALVGAAAMALLGGRLRRGIGVAVRPASA